MRNKLLILTMLSTLSSVGVRGQAGGIFTITQAAIAEGGGSSSNASGSVVSTVGQPTAGPAMRGGSVVITSGFWNYSQLAPTAATVCISGRVRTADGRGIPNAYVTLFRADGTSMTVVASPFGFYRFDQVISGETVVLEVSRKGVMFLQPMIAVSAADDISEFDLIGEPQ